MTPPQSHALPTVIVLASGRGERFAAAGGQGSKLHAVLAGKRVLDWTLEAVRASGLPWHVEDAGHPGMGDSIAAAVCATPGANGWLVLPADLPLVSAQTLLAVAQALQRAPVVVPYHQRVAPDTRGHPVGFGRACWPLLRNLKGNQGAAGVVAAQGAIKLIVNDIGILTDIDTPQDLATAQQLLGQRQNARQ